MGIILDSSWGHQFGNVQWHGPQLVTGHPVGFEPSAKCTLQTKSRRRVSWLAICFYHLTHHLPRLRGKSWGLTRLSSNKEGGMTSIPVLGLLWVPFRTWRKGAECIPVGTSSQASLFPTAQGVYNQWGESQSGQRPLTQHSKGVALGSSFHIVKACWGGFKFFKKPGRFLSPLLL